MPLNQPTLTISPIRSSVDEEVTILVTGCRPNEMVTIRATTKDDNDKAFFSLARFHTDDSGEVNLSAATPASGTYTEADASGLFWSMESSDAGSQDYFTKVEATPLSVEVTLEIEGQIVETVTLLRYFYTEDVHRNRIKEDGVVGVMFHPEAEGPYPGVLLLGGSDGGIQEQSAALLASKGYSVLALAYFGTEDVSKDLENIPLEYFKGAKTWLKNHETVNGNVSVIGFSKGGELALVLAASFDEFQTVIAGAPSAFVTSGIKNMVPAPVPSWTIDQKPVPYMKFTYRLSTMFSMGKNWLLRRPVSFLSIWNHSLHDLDKIEESRIPVEKINAPVMTIAGRQDELWPSAYFARLVEQEASHLSAANVHLYYEDAGHFLSFPYGLPGMPANIYEQAGGRMTISFGGSKKANAQAAQDSWPKILRFLEKHTKQSRDKQATTRFSDRVSYYVKHRPRYPFEIIRFLEGKSILNSESVIADIGSGTGFLTEPFLKNGNQVYGVEPNQEMRKASDQLLRNYDRFTSINGAAERTTLTENSIDLIVAGQAFHWFDVAPTKVEFQRILKPAGYVALIWNERKQGSAFIQEYEQLLATYGTDYKKVSYKNLSEQTFKEFFGGTYQLEVLGNAQHFGFEGLKGRLLSSSYIPLEDSPLYEEMITDLHTLFERYEQDNEVIFEYDTKIYYGQLKDTKMFDHHQ